MIAQTLYLLFVNEGFIFSDAVTQREDAKTEIKYAAPIPKEPPHNMTTQNIPLLVSYNREAKVTAK